MNKGTARNALQSALVATGLACAIHAGATSVTISISGGLVQAESGDPLPAGSMLQLINLGPNGVFDPIPAGSWAGGDDSVVTMPFASGEANLDGYATAACFDLTDGLDTPGTFDRVFTLELGATLRAGDRLGMRWFAGVPASNGFGSAPPAPGTPHGQFTRQETPLHGGVVWIVPAAASVVTFDSLITTSFGGLDAENPGLGNGANLSNLELSAGTLAPAFAMATTTYSASVSNPTLSMTVTPTVADNAATLQVNGVTLASGTPSGPINLNVGANIITILVTGSNGTTTKTYSLVVKRQSPIESWRQTWFGTPGNSGNAVDTANPDGDADVNRLEFAFGTNPNVSQSNNISYVGNVIAPGAATVQIRNLLFGVDFRVLFGRRKDYVAAGLGYSVEFSADFTAWVAPGIAPTVVADDGVMQAVTVPYPLALNGKKPQFFRIVVSGP